MSGIKDYRRKGTYKVKNEELSNKKQSSIELKGLGDEVVATTNSYSGAMSFEVSNIDDNDLSTTITINIEMSVSGSGSNYNLATDINDNDLTYTLAQGDVVMDAISGIPKGTILRIVVVTPATGTLNITTRQ